MLDREYSCLLGMIRPSFQSICFWYMCNVIWFLYEQQRRKIMRNLRPAKPNPLNQERRL